MITPILDKALFTRIDHVKNKDVPSVSFKSVGVHEKYTTDSKGKQCISIAMIIQMTNNKTNATEQFDFTVGIGHLKGVSSKKSSDRYIMRNVIEPTEKLQKYYYNNSNKRNVTGTHIVVDVDIRGVINCLLMDASAQDQTFVDWCNDFGYNSDSIRDLELYNLCIKNADKLHNIIDRKQWETISEELQDY